MDELELPALGSRVGGDLVEGGEPFVVENPATAEVICELPAADETVVDEAVGAARAAFEGEWGAMSPGRRCRVLEGLASLVDANASTLAALESTENGMPLSVVRSFSVAALAKSIGYYASWIDKAVGDVVPMGAKALDYVVREPYGVIGAMTAYNTPSLFIGSKAGPSLAAGNALVLKPSPQASLPALRFAELCAEAGLPDGAVNVVLGGSDTGRSLVAHRGIDKLSFTGSVAAGRAVAALAAEQLTPVATELGGKSPNIVFADADLGRVATGAALGAWALTGQACAAGSRLFVHSSVIDEVVESLVQMTGLFKVGMPDDPATTLGPLISSQHRERVEGFIERATGDGARVVVGGDRPGGDLEAGYFLRPAVVIDATDDSELCREEVFGPVVTVAPFDDEDEVVRRANDTLFGLAAGIWTSDVGRAHRMARRVQAGFVWVNTYGTVPHTAPFGGMKQSGSGREGSRLALDEHTQPKNVYVDLS